MNIFLYFQNRSYNLCDVMQVAKGTITTAIFIIFICFLTPSVTSKQRQGHNKRPTNKTVTKANSTNGPKRYRCGVKINNGCSCSKSQGLLAISCYNEQLHKVPTFELASNIVRTLNLENNFISEIEHGDFYGLKIERLLLGNNTLSQLNVLSFWGLEYYLETLNLSSNQFLTIPSPSLRLLRHLRSLSFSNNNIRHLEGYGFSSLDKLEVLALDNNPIEDIDRHAFAGTNLYLLLLDKLALKGLQSIPTGDLETLKGLSVSKNNIRTIPDQWFSNLTSLRFLKMDNNHLSHLDPGLFTEIQLSLRTLHLNGNNFHKVPKEAVCSLINLEILELSRNRIKKISGRTFNCSRNLVILDLSRNEISELSNSAFIGLDTIHKIDLRKNKLVTLDDRMFHWQNYHDKEIYLSGNPWLCNCLVKWIKKDYRKKSERISMFSDLTRMKCNLPDYLKGKAIVRVSLKDFTCDHDYYYYYEYE